MGEIHLIRHGQASFGERNYDRLSPTGIVQSRRLGAWWRENGIDFDAVFSGERERQKDTALLALEERGKSPGPLGIDPSFNELDADRLLHHALPRLILREPQLASLLLDLPANRDLMARRLERYPNFAVDTAARVKDLERQPREKVRAFLIRYQDRVLYATDLGLSAQKDVAKTIDSMRKVYALDWKYFATDERIETRAGRVQGLALPPEVLRKIFRENALRWVPGADR